MTNDKSKDKVELLGEYLRHRKPSYEEEQSVLDQVWKDLRAEGDRVPENVFRDFRPRPATTIGRRLLWVGAAAALVFAVVLSGVLVRSGTPDFVASVEGTLERVHEKGSPPVRVGEKLAFGEVVRSGIGTGAVLTLNDGTEIEMRTNSELAIEKADDGVRIRLNGGGVLVTAAKQRTGHLYVQTKDATVSVVGTVFLVRVEEAGSCVAVIEGEVLVQQRGTKTKLHPGEQIHTNPLMELKSIKDEISWSRNAAQFLALLQENTKPAVSARESSKPSRRVFEVASIKATPSGETGNGSMTAFPPGGFRKTNATLKDLVRTAYGLQEFQVSGAPGWATKDRFNVEAKADGKVSRDQILLMIQDLLADRFKLKVRVTTEEIAVYALVPVKSGAKLRSVPESESEPATARINGYSGKKTIARFAEYLSGIVGQTVVDRTGLPGVYDIQLAFTPERILERFGGDLDDPPLGSALQDQLGLKLEPSKAPVQYVVIESAEPPSPN